MSAKQKRSISLVMALLVICMAALACNYDESEIEQNADAQYYAIEPDALMREIKLGMSPSFSPLADMPANIPVADQKAVNWKQSDYLQILAAVYKNIFKDSLDGWSFNSISFSLGCAKVETGFQDSTFRLFKVIKKLEREARLVRYVDIDPRNKSMYVFDAEYYPKLVDWIPIDIAKVKTSAENALQIAERNGGEQKRKDVNNACDISLLFSPSSISIYGWKVRYTQIGKAKPMFYLEIDPFSGEYK